MIVIPLRWGRGRKKSRKKIGGKRKQRREEERKEEIKKQGREGQKGRREKWRERRKEGRLVGFSMFSSWEMQLTYFSSAETMLQTTHEELTVKSHLLFTYM